MSNVVLASLAEQILGLLTHVLTAHRHVGTTRGKRIGGPLVQAIERGLIGGGVLLDRCERVPSCTAELSRAVTSEDGSAVTGAGGICAPAQAASAACTQHRKPTLPSVVSSCRQIVPK